MGYLNQHKPVKENIQWYIGLSINGGKKTFRHDIVSLAIHFVQRFFRFDLNWIFRIKNFLFDLLAILKRIKIER